MDRLVPSPVVPLYAPLDAEPLVFVAQSPGKREVADGIPLVGPSGQLAEDCARTAGIKWASCPRTNVIHYRPPGDDFHYFCASKKKDVGGRDYPLPYIRTGQYLKPEWFDQLDRLQNELTSLQPNLVVTFGNEALWALTQRSGITKWRGSVMESSLVPGLKVIPTFHPAAALREYSLKATIIMDLIKAQREAKFPEIRVKSRKISIYPSVDDLWEWERKHAPRGCPQGCPISWDEDHRHVPAAGRAKLCVDIETRPPNQVTCIGFAFSPDESLVVPFWSDLREGNNYWRTLEEELEAWEFIQHMLYTYPVFGQNFLAYDTMYLRTILGIQPRVVCDDTMTLHHAYQPELTKGLGFQTSIYCDEPAYKNLRPKGKKTEKRDE